jgi:hypothetical protein
LESDNAPGSGKPNRLLQQPIGSARSAGHEARMHQIEGACGQLGVVDVARHELDVVLAARPHALACMLEEDGIRIEADDLPRRADALAE